ncbi:MAG: TIR domain-containing protein [Opitutaceae bacterium]|nr:TIR domain-containing protein [Opitutaceae bacterium]
MSDSSQAVFLSYASRDAAAARRLCDALRAAGLEVWFDQSALAGARVASRRLAREPAPVKET